MLITAVHWFLIAIWHVAELNILALFAFAGLAYLAYRYRNLLGKTYHWLMKQRIKLLFWYHIESLHFLYVMKYLKFNY